MSTTTKLSNSHYDALRLSILRKGGYKMASCAQLDPRNDASFVAVIHRGNTPFMVHYDGDGGDYVYSGDQTEINNFRKLVTENIFPLDHAQQSNQLIADFMVSGKFDTVEGTVAFMIDVFEKRH